MEGSNGMMTILLRSNDGEEFNVPAAVAWESRILRHMTDDDDYAHGTVVPIPNINSKILTKVIEFCTKRVDASSSTASSKKSDNELSDWEQQFMDAVDKNTLFDLINAAIYLDIPWLLDATLEKLAELLRGKSVEEIRTTLNVKNDFTPEEEAAIQQKYQWAFA